MNEKEIFNLSNIAEIYPNEKIIETKDGKRYQATSQIINGHLWPQRHPNRLTDETSFLTWLRSSLHTDHTLEQSAKDQRLNAARSGWGLLRTSGEKHTIIHDGYHGDLEGFDKMVATVRPQISDEVEANKKNLVTQQKAHEENARQMNDPFKKLTRNWPHRTVNANRLEIVSVEKETVEVLEDIRKRVLTTNAESLWHTLAEDAAEQNKTSLLTWLNATIDTKKTNKENETLGKKFSRFVRLT
jgi:hypothetical protein